MSSAGPRGRRILRRAAFLLLLLASVSVAAFVPYAGQFLASGDPLARADAIIAIAGPRAERWLEAVDLYQAGWAPKILLSPGRSEPAEEEVRRRGVAFPSTVDLTRAAMAQLGVPGDALVVMPGSLDNTAQEATAARRIALDAGWRRLIVVTSKYHLRRTRFAFERAFRGTAVTIAVHASRYDPSVPERWWRHRADARWVASELQKLIAYRLGLGE